MSTRIVKPEIFGRREDGLTLYFGVEDDAGPVDAPARIRVDGEERAVSEGAAPSRCVHLTGLRPGTGFRIDIEVDGAPAPERDAYFPDRVETLPAPRAREVASFATLNDLHFGEPRFGGTIDEDGEYGEEAPGFPAVRETDTDVPYWRFMNEDAIGEINASGVDAAVIKGDIADRGRSHQFEAAREAFSRFSMPHHAFLGNHDYYAREVGEEVDGYALLGMPPAPRTLELGGWQLVLLETTEPGEHHGVFGSERLRWLDATLAAGRETGAPTLLFMHHHPVTPEHSHKYPNTIAIRPEDSLRLLDVVGRHPHVRGVLIGHTHRNRVRHYSASGRVPWIEVHCTKDYPGGWGHYRLFEDGSFRQEVRRTSTPAALEHSTRCRDFFRGGYRDFSLGRLEARSFEVTA